MNSSKELVTITTAGSVDDGKSTLIGRLLYDCNDIYEDILKRLKTDENGMVLGDELAYLTDGLEAEREQGITIDVAYRHFSRPNRKFLIADVPGHEQYTRNMVTGASKANVALIIADARKGLLKQSKRHLFISSLLGIKHIAVVVNKMDLVDYDKEVFERIKNDFSDYAAKMNIADLQFMPISAKAGDMVVNRGKNMIWYQGTTLLNYLETVQVSSDRNLIDFRFTVQSVVRPSQDFRGFTGRVEGGTMKVGDEIMVLPSGAQTRIKDIYLGFKKVETAFNPQSVLITTEDEIDISRGDIVVRKDNMPNKSDTLDATINWFDSSSLDMSKTYIFKHGSKEIRGKIDDIKYSIDVESLHSNRDANTLNQNDIGRTSVSLNEVLYFDVYKKNKNTGSFIVIDEITNKTVAAGVIISRGNKTSNFFDYKVEHKNKGAVLWFTGLSGSGKSTLADAVYDRILELGARTERLDGDILREHINKGLGFSKEDRDLNIKRASYISSLLSKHGVLVLSSFISPYKKQRELARSMSDKFVEIFVNAPVEVCIERDVKGLYKKALAGEIKNFTGVSDPYEIPENPELIINTHELSLEESVERVIGYLLKNKFIFK